MHLTPDLMSCQVVVEAEGKRHHQGHLFQARIMLHPDFEHLPVNQQVRLLEGLTQVGREARRICAA